MAEPQAGQIDFSKYADPTTPPPGVSAPAAPKIDFSQYAKPTIGGAPATTPTGKSRREPTVGQRTQKFFENHPVIREAALGAFAGVGLPESKAPVTEAAKGLYHTLTDRPQTKDEKLAEAVGMPVAPYRLVKGIVQQGYGLGQEAFDAVDWVKFWSDAKTLRPDLHLQLKQDKGPQLAHGLAGLGTLLVTAVLGSRKTPEAATRVAETPVKAVKSIAHVPESVTEIAQQSAGTGAKLAEETAAAKVAEIATENAKATAARQKWIEETAAERKTGREQAARAGRKDSLVRAQQEAARVLRETVPKIHDAVRATLDKRWDIFRERVGADRSTPAEGIVKAVENSRNMLAGVPADLTIFNQIMHEATEKGVKGAEVKGAAEAIPKDSIRFDDARTQYSAVGEKAYAAQGNVRRALFNVRDAYDAALQKAIKDAERDITSDSLAGAGGPSLTQQYGSLKGDWSQYMQDWHDLSNMDIGKPVRRKSSSGESVTTGVRGGSALARLYRSTNDAKAAALAMGRAGDLLRQELGRYRDYGANPELINHLQEYAQENKGMGKVGAIPTDTGLPEVPKDLPQIKQPPTIDAMVTELKQAKDAAFKEHRTKQRTFGKHDSIMLAITAGDIGGSALSTLGTSHIGVSLGYASVYTGMRFGWMGITSSEAGMRWLTRVTPADIEVMRKVLDRMPEEKAAATSAITKGLIEQAKQGKPIPPLSKFSKLLDKAQIGAILRVIAPPQRAGQPQLKQAVAPEAVGVEP